MFSYVRLKNYKSLVDFNANLTNKRNTPRKLVLIYGENGSGKTNLVSSFETLSRLVLTKSASRNLDTLIDVIDNNEDVKNSILPNLLASTEKIISECKTISSTEDMVLEFGFKINNKKGVYKIITDNDKIIGESLGFIEKDELVNLFDISLNGVKFSEKIFKKRSGYQEDLKELVEKYWGKHSILSIVYYEMQDKNQKYISGALNKTLLDIILFFRSFSIRINNKHKQIARQMKYNNLVLSKLNLGEIEKEKEIELDKAEEFVNEFFTSLYADIKQVFYKKENIDDKIKYQLYVRKCVGNQLIDINFNQESAGTQYLLDTLPLLINSITGGVTIIDEFDNGIHDILVSSILKDIYDDLTGQLIITTHNTMLLETELAKDSVYFIDIDSNANKSLVSLNEFEKRIHPNNNVRKRYLSGLYTAIPLTKTLYFDDLVDGLELESSI